MKAKRTTKKEISDVLDFISGFETGDFSKQLGQTDDPILQPIIDKLNTAAKVLAAQADTSFIIDSLGIGIWKWDLITNALVWDKNMYRLYDADPTDFSGAYDAWENSLTDYAKAKAIEEINIAVAGGKSFDTTFQVVQRSTGKIQEIRTRAFVIRDENGKPLKMWGINIDRTRESELEIELKNALVNAARNSQLASLGEMASGIAHEINNPLTVLIGLSLILIQEFEKGVINHAIIRDYLLQINKMADRIAKITKGMGNISRNSENEAKSVCTFKDLITDLQSLASQKIKLEKIEMRINANEVDLLTPIFVHRVQLSQVLINLNNNAYDAIVENKYTERWIEISFKIEPHNLVIHIMDSGPGIPIEVIKKMFNPFFTTKEICKGTGIGLSISKTIIENAGGEFFYDDKCPNTCFIIKLPK